MTFHSNTRTKLINNLIMNFTAKTYQHVQYRTAYHQLTAQTECLTQPVVTCADRTEHVFSGEPKPWKFTARTEQVFSELTSDQICTLRAPHIRFLLITFGLVRLFAWKLHQLAGFEICHQKALKAHFPKKWTKQVFPVDSSYSYCL